MGRTGSRIVEDGEILKRKVVGFGSRLRLYL